MEDPSAEASRNKWADIQDDEDAFGEELEVQRPDGLKERIAYFTDHQNKSVKTIRVIKETVSIERTNKMVFERIRWPKLATFAASGAAGGSVGAEELDETKIMVPDPQEYSWVFPKGGASYRPDEDFEDDESGVVSAAAVSEEKVSIRPEIRRKFDALLRTLGEENRAKATTASGEAKADQPSAQLWRPSWRDRAGATGTSGHIPGRMDDQQREEATVRVTNLSEEVKDKDLVELFGSVGPIHRIYLAKHKEGGSKGFAFITYKKKEDARKAIATLHRFGYDNLLLNVETAKQPNRREDRDRPPPGGAPN